MISHSKPVCSFVVAAVVLSVSASFANDVLVSSLDLEPGATAAETLTLRPGMYVATVSAANISPSKLKLTARDTTAPVPASNNLSQGSPRSVTFTVSEMSTWRISVYNSSEDAADITLRVYRKPQ